jgi:L-alanine-DL-glutamate epimerase-like enolase superfamily enzyme
VPVIQSVEVCATRVSLDKVTSFSSRTVTNGYYGLVKIRTADGMEGVGFCYVGGAQFKVEKGNVLLLQALGLGFGFAEKAIDRYASASRTDGRVSVANAAVS